MGKLNSSSDKDQEVTSLANQYEAAKAENKKLYLDGDQLADLADKYATEQRFEEAQEVINYGLELHPNNTDLLIEQAYLYLDTQKLELAKDVAESITETYSLEVTILKAEILLNEGKLDDTLALLNSISDADDLDNILNIARFYIDMGYPEHAFAWLEKTAQEDREDEDYLDTMADCSYAENRLDQAVELYNKLIDIDPYNPLYWKGLSKSYFAKEEYEKSLESIEFAIAADEDFGEGHALRAHCLFYLSNEEEAIKEYQKAMEMKAIPPELAYMFIGMSYLNKKEWGQANEYFNKTIKAIGDESSPFLVDVYNDQAICLSKLGKDKAAHHLCSLIEMMNPEDPSPHLLEVRFYLEKENIEGARKEWFKAISIAPIADTWYQIGAIYLEYMKLDSAIIFFEKAWDLDPNIEELAEQLSILYLILGDLEGFQKYNRRSVAPMDIDELQERLISLGIDSKTTMEILQDLLTLQKKKTESEKKKNNKNKDNNLKID